MSKYKVGKGLAQVIITGEPVYVNSIEGNEAIIVRPVVSQDGLTYVEQRFPLEQLETRYTKAKREIEFNEFLQGLQEQGEEKRYGLNSAQMQAIAEAKRIN